MFKNKCELCENQNLALILNLEKQPWCNDYSNKKIIKKYPLKLFFCKNCSNLQLNYFLKKEIMFSNHDYLSGDNIELKHHFQKVSNRIIKAFSKIKKKSILDVGSNDGTFLINFLNKNWNVLGVEPSRKTFKIAKKNRVNTINAFFNYQILNKLKKKEFDAIHASGVFFHLEDINSVTKTIKILLKKNGIFYIQFIYAKDLIDKKQFDQIYHEHLYYYNLRSLNYLLNKYDLEIFDCKKSKVHGGSIIAQVGHKGINQKKRSYLSLLNKEEKSNFYQLNYYKNFQKNINLIKYNFLKRIKKFSKIYKNILVIGAPAKSTTFFNFIDSKQLKNLNIYVYEINKFKIGKYIPGTKLKILDEKKLDRRLIKDSIFLISSWNYKKQIIEKLKKQYGKNIKYFFPY